MTDKPQMMVTIQIIGELIKLEMGTKIGEVLFTPEDATRFGEALIKRSEEAKAKRVTTKEGAQ